MASFELSSNSCDGHIRALSKAILMASKISKDALLEFTPEKMRLCSRTPELLIKFVFNRDFFTDYKCDKRHRCYINLKALYMPFKSSILVADREGSLRSQITIKCSVEDEVNNQIVFKIGAEPPSASLTYKLTINDLDPDRMHLLNAINRTIDFARVEMSPKPCKKERFLLSAFNNFPPDIDQVTIQTSPSEVKFIGSTSPSVTKRSNATSEFRHKKDDFSTFFVREDVNITLPLRHLKLFLTFVETNRVQTLPKYIFEGEGLPAHFIYDAQLYKGHYVTSTSCELVHHEMSDDFILPITMGQNESFIVDDDVIQAEDDILDVEGIDEVEEGYNEEEEEDGYNDNQSDNSDLLDGNLEGLDTTGATSARNTSMHNTSLFGGNESIRSEIGDQMTYDIEMAKEILDLDQDPDEIENREIQYSDDSDG